ncbi:MAG: peptidylprolyl isomerase [Bacteroidales bacterium]|nr:peptidylprolyl isomerase [Bacteroidales bacterium]MBQ3595995.1 peptidylprolyl isomerase [Bacteroidales bacterium]
MKRFFLIISFVLFAVSSKAQEPQVIDRVVAVVGQNIILQSDIEAQYMQLRLQGGIQGSASSIRCEILEDLMFRKLMLNQAEMDSITVTDEQVNAEVDRLVRYFISQLGSQENLEKYYKKSMSEIKEELFRMRKDQMLEEQVQQTMLANVEVTPAEVRKCYYDIPHDSVPMVNSKYEIAHIVKKPAITLEQKLEVKDRLYKMRKRILDGERFSTLALLYSEDPGSAKKGGELGFHGRGEFAPEFEAAAFNLRDGEISEVIETEFGFHIIQMIERRGEFVNVRHILLTVKVSPEALQEAYDELDSIAKLINNDSITFDEAVRKFSDENDKISGGILVNPNTGSTLFDASELDQQVSFTINRMQVGELSEPVPMKTDDNKDAYRLLYLKRKTAPHKANLKDDYTLIRDWAMQQKREEIINKWIANNSQKAYIKVIDDFKDCDFMFDWKFAE